MIKKKAWLHSPKSAYQTFNVDPPARQVRLRIACAFGLTFARSLGIDRALSAAPRGARHLTISEHKMANTASAKKMTRKIERRTLVNTARRSRVRTFIRKVEEAIASGDGAAATAALRVAEPEIMRAVSKGVVHHNTASRKVSRLAQRVKAVATTA
jgi:small subunit ribosomal protein S20